MTNARRRPLGALGAVLLLAFALSIAGGLVSGAAAAGSTVSSGSVTILGPSATSFDPAVQSDAGTAQIVAQLFESLTAVDASGHLQPALARSWSTDEGGRRVVFQLRSGLTFSDGSPLRASDVVFSWLRVLNPRQPSQLAPLLDDVVGARDYREGKGPKTAVGIKAPDDTRVEVSLINPASDFPGIASSPTLAVVPSNIDSRPAVLRPGSFVGSGAYTLTAETDTETTLLANKLYWAGPPPIKTVHVLSSIGGKSPVSEFEAGHLDYTPISLYDASWIEYDRKLGPSLRIEPSPSIEYYGFNTSRAPFDNEHVRRAFALGIDWRKVVALLADPLESPATGMVPPGVPGHSEQDFGPTFDLATARSELAAGGYPNGSGFPKITLVTAGAALDAAIVAQLKQNLGIDIAYQQMDVEDYYQKLLADPPAFWQMGWVADYPGANDFLGILLGTGDTNNFGRWSNAEFDAAIEAALAAGDPAAMQAAFDRAQGVVRDQAPVIPVDYGAGYSLAAPGLLGAIPNGQGLVRYAGMSWANK